MGSNINEKYETAYDIYGKVFEKAEGDTLNEKINDAISKTVASMKMLGLIEDEEALIDYLHSRISL